MTAARRLPVRVPGRAGEPAYALFRRLAVETGARSVAAFAAECGLDLAALRQGTSSEAVAALAGHDPESVRRSTFVVSDGAVRLGIESVDRTHWSWRGERVCAVCLDEDIPWRRSWWDLTPLRRCHLHGTRLAATKTGVEPEGGERDAPRLTDTRAERYVLGRLGFLPRTWAAILDALPLSRATDLMELVGASADGHRWGLRDPRRIDPAELLARGFAILGTGGLAGHLDLLVDTARVGRDGLGPGEAYGRLYRWLSSEDRDRAFDGVREILREHACRRLPVAEGTTILGRPAPAQRSWSLAQAAARMGVQKPLAARLIRAAGGEGELVGGLAAFPTEAVDAGRSFHERTIWGSQAARQLGLSRSSFTSVVGAGCLRPALDGTVAGTREDRFLREDVERLALAALEGCDALPACPPGAADLVTAARSAMSSTGLLLSAVLDERLRPVGRLEGRPGLGGLLVLVRAAFDLHGAQVDADDGSVAWAEVVATLGRKSVADALVAGGHLARGTVPMGFRNRRRQAVSRAQWARFRLRYVSAAELARGRGTSVAAVTKDFGQNGVRPEIVAAGRRFFARV